MKYSLTFLFLIIYQFCYGQVLDSTYIKINNDSCYYVKESIDEFTGVRKISSDFLRLGDITYSVSKEKGKIGLYLSFPTSSVVSVPTGELIYLKFTDESIIKMVINKTTISDVDSYGGVYSSFFYFLNPETLKVLKNKHLKKIRMYIFDYDILEGDADLFSKVIKCVASK